MVRSIIEVTEIVDCERQSAPGYRFYKRWIIGVEVQPRPAGFIEFDVTQRYGYSRLLGETFPQELLPLMDRDVTSEFPNRCENHSNWGRLVGIRETLDANSARSTAPRPRVFPATLHAIPAFLDVDNDRSLGAMKVVQLKGIARALREHVTPDEDGEIAQQK